MDFKQVEEWKSLDFLGYPNYKVSNLGHVMSINYGIMSNNKINKGGYNIVKLYKDGKRKYHLVHRLVAMAFVDNPNPEKFNIVNHIDENKLNNRWDNLEWCDIAYNVTYGTAIERQHKSNLEAGNYDKLKQMNKKQVYKYDFNGKLVYIFDSMTNCYKEDGVSGNVILSETPVRNDCIYSYKELSEYQIRFIVNNIIKNKNDKLNRDIINIYQYNCRKELVEKHVSLSDMKKRFGSKKTNNILSCVHNTKIYASYIWSNKPLEEFELDELIYIMKDYKTIYRYDLDNFECTKYENIDLIPKEFNKTSIISCCNNRCLTHLKYVWSYNLIELDKLKIIKNRSCGDSIKKKVYQYNLLGDFIKEWNCIEDCIKDGYSKSKLHECFKGMKYQHNGYIWSKVKLSNLELELKIEEVINNTSVKPVYQYTKDMKLVKAWETTTLASKNGYPISPISECCRGKRKTYKGYVWSYRKLNNE